MIATSPVLRRPQAARTTAIATKAADIMLRDLAFVLKMTAKVSNEIRAERAAVARAGVN